MDPSIFRVRYALAFRSMVNLFRTPRFGAIMLLTDWDGKERESLRYLSTYAGLLIWGCLRARMGLGKKRDWGFKSSRHTQTC